MTVYFNPKQETKEEKEKRESYEAVGSIANFFLKPLILWQCWNWVIPGLFGLPPLGYLSSLALYVISRILFDRNESKYHFSLKGVVGSCQF